MSTDDMKMVGEMLSKAIGGGGTSTLTKVTGPGGTAVDTLVFEGDMTLMMTALGCGGRHVLVATGGRDGALSLHERIVASFVCKPDPTQEAHARISFPLVLDLPGWWLSEDAPDQLQITNGAAVLSLRAQEPNLKVDIAMIVEPMFKAAGVEGHITSKQGDRVNITMSDGSDSMAGWVRLVPCPTATAFVLALAPDAATLDELYSKVTSGRCLRSGESPQQWPTKPQ
jgi:hypothetical protein